MVSLCHFLHRLGGSFHAVIQSRYENIQKRRLADRPLTATGRALCSCRKFNFRYILWVRFSVRLENLRLARRSVYILRYF